MSLTLSDAELLDLTGYKQHAKRVQWLRKNGIRHYVRPDGRVRVLRSDLGPTAHPILPPTQPNFAAVGGRR